MIASTMGKPRDLPPRVFPKSGRYYLVRADGKRRVWVPLTRVADGLAALYGALAQLATADVADDRMPALVAAWQREVMPAHAEKTRRDETARGKVVAEAFADFRACEVRAPDVSQFLLPLRTKARTHNAYRSLLRELMRFAVEKGYRDDNPVEHVRTVGEKPRTRYLTDSEIRRIKVGGMYGNDGRRTRSGAMLAALIDMAYLTGQDVGMLLAMRWQRDPDDPEAPYVADAGLFFRRSKVRGSTGAAVLIEWTPRLRDLVARLRKMRAERRLKKRAEQRVVSEYLFTTQGGKQLTYSGAITAWRRALKRAEIRGAMFRDIRAKALTDKEAAEDMKAASAMGAHSTESQTADYVRRRTGRKTSATR